MCNSCNSKKHQTKPNRTIFRSLKMTFEIWQMIENFGKMGKIFAINQNFQK